MLSNIPAGSDTADAPWNEEDVEMVSICCSAKVIENTDICDACREHCEEIEEGSQ